MKTLIIASAVLSTASTLFAQGYVSFANSVNSRVSNEGVLQTAAPVGSYYYALLIAPSTQNTVSSADGSFTGWQLAAIGTNTPTAGRLTGNNADAGTAVAIPGSTGFGVGSTADFVVVGWSGNIGSDWNSVRAGFHGFGQAPTWTVADSSKPGGAQFAWFGISVVANDVILNPQGSPYNSVFGAATILGLNLVRVIPEPSQYVLATLCAAVVLVWRPRKEEQI